MKRLVFVVIGVAALLMLVTRPAYAQPQEMACELSVGSAQALPVWTPDMLLTATPAEAAVGTDVALSLDVGTYTNGPVPIPAGQLTPTTTVVLSGGQTGDVTLSGQPNAEAINALAEYVPGPMVATLPVTGSGAIDLTVTNVTFVNPVVSIICTPNGVPLVLATVTASGGTAPTESPSETPDATESPSESPSASLFETPGAEESTEDDDSSSLPLILGGAALVAALAGGGFLLYKRSQEAGAP